MIDRKYESVFMKYSFFILFNRYEVIIRRYSPFENIFCGLCILHWLEDTLLCHRNDGWSGGLRMRNW